MSEMKRYTSTIGSIATGQSPEDIRTAWANKFAQEYFRMGESAYALYCAQMSGLNKDILIARINQFSQQVAQ
jgi:hypothetical protein